MRSSGNEKHPDPHDTTTRSLERNRGKGRYAHTTTIDARTWKVTELLVEAPVIFRLHPYSVTGTTSCPTHSRSGDQKKADPRLRAQPPKVAHSSKLACSTGSHPRRSHEGVKEKMLHGHKAPAEEVVDHDLVVVHREQRREELGRDRHEGEVLDVRVYEEAANRTSAKKKKKKTRSKLL